MLKKLCSWLLYSTLGWSKNITINHPEKYIICLAPHTSNWDFIFGQLYSFAEDMRINFLMKAEWFVGPLKPLFKSLGGIPVTRSKKGKLTDLLAETAVNSKQFKLCITPEGTRSLNTEWKQGFYFIALKANIPILLYGLDYHKKCIQCTKMIMPTGNIEREMNEIKLYFKNFRGKNPEQFSIGDVQS